MRIEWMRIQFVSKLNQVWKGLKNAPAVFQWLVEKFLQQLNLVDGKEFVSVYIDDILVFSFFFQEHMWSMCHKSSKLCRMLDGNWNLLSVDWSGISWLSSNSWWSALQCFPEKSCFQISLSIFFHEHGQFIGLASYYCRFTGGFASLAQPLHLLTWKGAKFVWSIAC